MKNINFTIFIFLIVSIYIIGLPVDVMDVDASQYASISREMLESGSLLEVKERNANYLDKPPLTFWLSTLSYSLFGINNIAYKLPSLLFTLLCLLCTHKFARLYYSENIARLAVLITASCQAFFLINIDCRTDTVLTGAIMMAICYLSVYLKSHNKWHFYLGFVGIGLAMLTKGPLGLVIPSMAIGVHLILKKQWKDIFRIEWLAGICIVAVMLVPMCIGLYTQYGTDGLVFYFWKQSFGRITGDNDFVKQLTESDYVNDPTYFLHTFLWAFLPWSLVFLAGLFIYFKNMFTKKLWSVNTEELISVSGFILTIIMMSLSKYKLPHYIFMVFPLAGILTARFFMESLKGRVLNTLWISHVFLMTVLWGIIFWLAFIAFPSSGLSLYVIFFACLALVIVVLIKSESENRLFRILILTVMFMNLMLNFHIYPQLLKYQCTNTIGRIIRKENISVNKIYNYTGTSHSLDFYAERIIPYSLVNDGKWGGKQYASGEYLILNQDQYSEILKSHLRVSKLYSGETYPVSLLTGEFLNPATRLNTTKTLILIKVL